MLSVSVPQIEFASETILPGVTPITATNWVEVFVNGKRLKKNSFETYNVVTGNTIVNNPEFSATFDPNSGNITVEFTTAPAAGSSITVTGRFEQLPDEITGIDKFRVDFASIPSTNEFINQTLSLEI